MNVLILLALMFGNPEPNGPKPIIRNDPHSIPAAPAVMRHAKPVIRN